MRFTQAQIDDMCRPRSPAEADRMLAAAHAVAVARLDAVLPVEREPLVPTHVGDAFVGGECTCVCDLRDRECECYRKTGLVIDENGDPKLATEPCDPRAERTDALDIDTARARRDEAYARAGHAAAPPPVVHVDAAPAAPLNIEAARAQRDRAMLDAWRVR